MIVEAAEFLLRALALATAAPIVFSGAADVPAAESEPLLASTKMDVVEQTDERGQQRKRARTTAPSLV